MPLFLAILSFLSTGIRLLSTIFSRGLYLYFGRYRHRIFLSVPESGAGVAGFKSERNLNHLDPLT